jgi:cellobiose-specific phosphotransferase system component IIC
MEHDPALVVAEKHVKAVRDFFYHLMVFVVVCAVLVIVDLRVTTDQAVLGLDWAYWVILFWGLGLAGHAISVFFDNYRVTKEYEELKANQPRTPVA